MKSILILLVTICASAYAHADAFSQAAPEQYVFVGPEVICDATQCRQVSCSEAGMNYYYYRAYGRPYDAGFRTWYEGNRVPGTGECFGYGSGNCKQHLVVTAKNPDGVWMDGLPVTEQSSAIECHSHQYTIWDMLFL